MPILQVFQLHTQSNLLTSETHSVFFDEIGMLMAISNILT